SVEHRSGPVSGRDRGGHELLHHDRQRPPHPRGRGRPYPGRAALLLRPGRGRTRFEHYCSSTAAESRPIFSVTKSVTSTLVGIAISEGRLRLDERLSQMLPRYAAEMTPSVARVTLRQLLTHTAGFTDTWNIQLGELVTSPDWVRFILKHQ